MKNFNKVVYIDRPVTSKSRWTTTIVPQLLPSPRMTKTIKIDFKVYGDVKVKK
ncbi:hypothetical protein DERF_004289 [Dermatophagoides farinae]|uniref:Uncharacterized protein n=1 Tax=Dermatophagoides farinae TaxID=6954 RepID=A0A922L7K0_DERFA|nr:hypothetical protein DERF_004289 [Dermatophagoides farinae]